MDIERRVGTDWRFRDVKVGQCFEKPEMILGMCGYVDYGGDDLYMRTEPFHGENAVHLKTGKLVYFEENELVMLPKVKLIVT